MTSLMFPPAPWLLSVGLPLILGLSAWALRLVRRSAVIAGVPLGVLVLRLGGLAGFLILAGFFLLGTVLTRVGFSVKASRGVAEGSGGRRGASHVFANCAMGLLLLVVRAGVHASSGGGGITFPIDALLWAGFVGSFATAASDTSSSEIGQLLGRHPISLRTFRAVPIGTEGAVSLEGLLAGLGASALLAGLGWGVGLLSAVGFVAVSLGGFLGNVMESLAGTWGRRVLPHGLLNFANTAVGAALAALGVAWMSTR